MTIQNLLATTVAALGLLSVVPAHAADPYPVRAVTIIAPSGAGGGFDFVGRVLGQALTEQTKGSFIVENRTGAGTVVGTKMAAGATADGYTLLVGGLSNMVFNSALYASLPYDAQADFTPIAVVARYPYMLAAHSELKQDSVQAIVAEAKAKPGQVTIGTAGAGTGQHILAAYFAKATSIKPLLVPYKGAQAVYIDLLSGRVDLFFDTLPSVKPHLDSHKAKALFITSPARNPAVPEVPTAREVGLPQLEMGSWFGLFAPRKTPPAIVAQLRAAIEVAMKDPAFRARMEGAGIELMAMNPTQTDAFMKAEFSKWTGIIKQAGITAEQ
jgi:tripartite-type tricarboxylate transporter receptor subunit TctC